jgi:hypothetical protein
MPQTILAFLAMMIASMAAFNHQLAAVRVQEDRIHIELEIMANAVGLEAMELQAVPMGYDGLATMDDRETQSLFQVEGASETFTLEWDVQYVDASGNPSATPTPLREVAIEVFHAKYPTLPLVRHTRIIPKD